MKLQDKDNTLVFFSVQIAILFISRVFKLVRAEAMEVF